MKRFLSLILLFLFSTVFLYSQSDSTKCPSFHVEGPSGNPRPGIAVPFKIVLGKDFPISSVTYRWFVSNGKFLSGQGTTLILVESPKDFNTNITVTVEVSGLPMTCPKTASESLFLELPPFALRIDEYEKINVSDENVRLKYFSEALQNDPYSTGHFRKVFRRGFSKSAAYRNLRQVLNRLKSYGIDENRVTFGLAFGEKEFTQIFIVPAGAASPFEIGDEILKAAQFVRKTNNIKRKSSKQL